jgi:NAD(P)-dependent dehydrogenase (short-subunit alcohol dehydrogenase family)
MYNVFDVTKKRIVLSGGARGIGAAVARHLVAAGAHVAIFDVLDEHGESHVASLNATGPGKAFYFHLDISNRDEAFTVMGKAVDALGGLDSLHNIAGIERNVPIEDITDADVDPIFNVNFKGTLWLAQAALPHMKASSGGTIINIGSDSALMPFPDSPHYSASKGAVHSLTRTMAAVWAQHNIRANAVIPAAKTEMYEEIQARRTPEERTRIAAWIKTAIPLGGDLSSVDDVAPMLVYLTSDAGKFVTGQLLPVNGGLGFVR